MGNNTLQTQINDFIEKTGCPAYIIATNCDVSKATMYRILKNEYICSSKTEAKIKNFIEEYKSQKGQNTAEKPLLEQLNEFIEKTNLPISIIAEGCGVPTSTLDKILKRKGACQKKTKIKIKEFIKKYYLLAQVFKEKKIENFLKDNAKPLKPFI